MKEFFLSKYSNKIKKVDQLLKIVGNFPRKKKIIMCHGNFDIVHPGHVRHLTYAKSKAAILIASITADKMIKKGTHRPHVPQKLRALNLAAFEMVDYVIIDNNVTPINNIKKIKPDYFAKGFEYTAKSLPPATTEEKKIVEKYGGKMIFTPGDIVYSSSRLLNIAEPSINLDKLLNVMNEYNIEFKNLEEILRSKKKLKVHVVGDLIIDKYTRTKLIGYNAKTPTPSVIMQKFDKYVGGAAIVALHLKSSGIETTFSTVVGDDSNSKFAKKLLEKEGIITNFFIDKLRPTTEKNTILADEYRLLKVDSVDNSPISSDAVDYLSNKIQKTTCDAIVFSDFRHGIFNKGTIKNFIKKIPKKTLKIADSQVASRWGNITDYKHFNLITPNEKECRFSLADQDSSISELTRQLSRKTKFKNLILKLGARGTFVVSKNLQKTGGGFTISSFVKNLADPVGAGDALLSYATMGLLKSKSIVVAGILGSLAASCECEIDGNKPIKKELILNKINELQKQIKISE
jgi:rfaE bifunctional protein kinase chain/domain/rfaE bifunctional protein nucleotidyltransferase chain/domain